MTERLLTRSEVAARWRVSEKTVDRRRADGSLQGTLIGGVWRYSLADVEACEQRGREAWREQVAHVRKGRSTGSAEESGTPPIETETARSAAAALAARIGRELRSGTSGPEAGGAVTTLAPGESAIFENGGWKRQYA